MFNRFRQLTGSGLASRVSYWGLKGSPDRAGARRGLVRPVLTFSGAASGTHTFSGINGNTLKFFTTAGTYTITVNVAMRIKLIGVAAGGAGGVANFLTGGSIQDGGGGGGGGCYTSGTVVTLYPGKTYTLVIPAAATSGANGANLTLGDGTSTFVSLQGGRAGQSATGGRAGGAGGASGSSTGSNLVSGGAGGTGSLEAAGGNTNAANNATGAAGGGGGNSADGLGTGLTGGTGLNEAGQGPQATTAGHGGGVDVNGTKFGGGGGGGTNDNVNDVAGQASEAGAASFQLAY